MAERRVTHTRKNDEGDILAVGNPDACWTLRWSRDAVRDIIRGRHAYYVLQNGHRATVHVVVDARVEGGSYLRTYADSTLVNNLDELPDC